MKLKIVELFCGTKSFSNVAQERGHKTFTVDIDKSFNPDLVFDLTKNILDSKILSKKIQESDIVWMSPPCTTFSMASGNKHWDIDKNAKTQEAFIGKRLLSVCRGIGDYCDGLGKIYFIENPRARARWFLPNDKTRHTIWYCQYGDKRAKPTDIWTNLSDWDGKQCNNGNKNCHHEPAPRGSKTGTQGLKGSMQRGQVPRELCIELLELIEKERGGHKKE